MIKMIDQLRNLSYRSGGIGLIWDCQKSSSVIVPKLIYRYVYGQYIIREQGKTKVSKQHSDDRDGRKATSGPKINTFSLFWIGRMILNLGSKA